MRTIPALLLAALVGISSCSKSKREQKPPAPEQEKPAETQPTSKPTPPKEEAVFLEDIDAKRAGDLIKLPHPPVVIDVRTPGEFVTGHIDGAINIDFKGENFEAELAKLDLEKTYLMHCQSGGRSGMAKPTFTKLGFKHLYHLDGGFMAWEDAGLPTAK